MVERLRMLSDVIAVRANQTGRLQLSVSTDAVSTDVEWIGLDSPNMGSSAFMSCNVQMLILINSQTRLHTPRAPKGEQPRGQPEPVLPSALPKQNIHCVHLYQGFSQIPEQPCRINSNNCM